MRLDIRYRTRFEYDAPVRESSNELRACPTTDERQQLISYRVETAPTARVRYAVDYWGTRVDSFSIREQHAFLVIVAEATVETTRPPLLTASPLRSQAADPVFLEEHVEYLQRTEHTDWTPVVAEEAARRVEPAGDDLVGAVLALHRTVATRLTYAPGTTYVGVPVSAVLERGEGVCQDFAHLLIALCRSQGIPARYASGYLFTVDDASGGDSDEDVVNVQTHAWVEVAIPGAGWWSLDPTNRQEVGERHVKIGHGRDYGDVPPLRGTFSGPPAHQMDVAVEMRRTSVGSMTQIQQAHQRQMAAMQQQ